jgi:hypothetical protein
MWIFKADIAGCFNQLHWAKSAVQLMGFKSMQLVRVVVSLLL